ncbi:MAG TPA: hypothetical protein VK661_10565 [Planctomycetota bacterium]|jgi:hypothetical protein|nr:hypothetical protein [Planctomycetota bacterium]
MKIPAWLIFTACVGGFAALCWDAGVRLPEAYPTIGRCQADPARYAGREIWIIPARVSASDPEGYEVQHGGGGRVRIRATSQPPPGAYVYVRGTFQADGVVDQKSILVDTHFIAERNGTVAISVLTLILFAGFFHRTFAWRSGTFHVR